MTQTTNHWELYSSMRGWKGATKALDRAWKQAQRLDTAKEAHFYVEKIMAKYAHLGACDSEPRYHLARRLRARYGEECEYQPGWTTPVPYKEWIKTQ